MNSSQCLQRLAAIIVLLSLVTASTVRAQTNVSVYATGLVSPMGLEIDAQGRLWVAEQGTGNNDSRISVETTDGHVHPFLTGLPSELVEGDPLGAEHLHFDGNGNLLIMQGEGSDWLSESMLTIDVSGFVPGDTARRLNDLTAVHRIGPFALRNGAPSTNPYAMAFGPDKNLYIVDSGANGIVKLDRCTDNLSVFVGFDLISNPTTEGPPMIDPVPTGIVAAGNKFYVGLFLGFPFLPDSSRIMEVELGGRITTLRNGLTSVVDLAIDPSDGNLVFVQYARWEFPFVPNTGGVFKLKAGKVDTIAYGLNFPTGLRFAPNGDLFVSSFADGQILKITSPLAVGVWRLQTTVSGNLPLVSVKAVSRDVAWIAGFGGTVYRTTDGGKNWIPTATKASTTEALACITALDATTAFAGGGGPDWGGGNTKIYRTTNGGQSWEAVYTATGANSFWNWIHFFDSQNGIAQSDPPVAGGNFLIVKTSDGGKTWTPIANPPDANTNEYGVSNSFHFYDNLNGWFGTGHPPFVPGGSAGRVFHTTDGGNTWTPFASGNGNSVNAERFISPTVGIRTSNTAPFLTRSGDGGQTWTPVNGLPVANIRQMVAATGVNTPSLNQLWVYGEADAPFILSSTDGGVTWQRQPIVGTVEYPIFHLSAVTIGASSDSVQAFGITLDINTLAHGGQIFNHRERLGFVTGVKEPASLPLEYTLSQNYPNPFNPETRIRYQLANPDRVALKIYNMLGQEVRTLIDEFKPAGSYEVSWDGKDNAGQRAPSGMYLYRVEAQGLVQTKKMILAK
ncbi:MAG: Ycf48-like protein [bacterium]|nr:Ycf48-like protein [bacterium]